MLNNAAPDDIDQIDAKEGEIDVFAGILKIYEGKDTFRTTRIYTSVHCYEDGLPLPKGKGGRPRRFDPTAVAVEVQELMDHHGEFRPDDPEWDAQARLTDAIRAKFGEAADSTIEEYIKEPLTRWREQRSNRPET
jgi:hypothetical protein